MLCIEFHSELVWIITFANENVFIMPFAYFYRKRQDLPLSLVVRGAAAWG